MKLSPIHRRDLIRKMRNLGWDGPWSGTKHQVMFKGPRQIPIPNPHGHGEISVSKLRELLREMDVTPQQWHDA
jgi:hypothetical protein